MLKRHEIEVLLKAGHAKIEVARLAGVSLSSVKRIAEEDPVVHVDDTAERGQRRIGRPSIVENFRKPVVEILQEKADLPSVKSCGEFGERATRGARAHFTPWWPPCGRRRSSPWPLGSGGDRDYSCQGILTSGREVSDAPEGRIQEDEPERGGEAPHRLQGGHGGPRQVHDRRAAGVHPGLRPEAPVAGAAHERPLVLSASARRPYLEAESERLNYRWEEEVFSAHPDGEQLERWDLELQGVEHGLARLERERGCESASRSISGRRAAR